MKHADGSMNALQKGEVLDWLADLNKPSDEAKLYQMLDSLLKV